MNLSIYLTELLKSNDCVIVPDLGGFIANFQGAGYDAQNNQFSPPTKEIIFSAKLKKNDGLLVNFVMEKEGVGYLEARKIVSEYVSECIFKLENRETVEFDQLGKLLFDPHDNLIFEVDPRANLRADAFGLGTYHFPPLIHKYNQPPKPVFRDKEPEPQKSRRPALKYALIAIPVLVAIYFLPLSKIIHRQDTPNQSAQNTASLAVADAPPPSGPAVGAPAAVAQANPNNEVKSEPNEVKTQIQTSEPAADHQPVVPTTVVPKITPPVKEPMQAVVHANPSPSASGKFHVVGGCFKVKENADKLADRLVKEGYHAYVSPMGRGFFRVSVESYQTRKEAEQGLEKILGSDPQTGYWLMADKK